MSYAEPSSGANYSTSFAFFKVLSLLTSITCMCRRFSAPIQTLPVKLDFFCLGLGRRFLIIPFFGEDLTLNNVSFSTPFSDGALSFRSSKISSRSLQAYQTHYYPE